MGFVGRLLSRISGKRSPLTRVVDSSERRLCPRFVDGSNAAIITTEDRQKADVRSSRGRRLSCPAEASAVILDVNPGGARFHSRQLLPLHRRVWCRVSFQSQEMDLGMKILWSRHTGDGFEYGAAYTPIVPGTEHLMDNYTQMVLNRGA